MAHSPKLAPVAESPESRTDAENRRTRENQAWQEFCEDRRYQLSILDGSIAALNYDNDGMSNFLRSSTARFLRDVVADEIEKADAAERQRIFAFLDGRAPANDKTVAILTQVRDAVAQEIEEANAAEFAADQKYGDAIQICAALSVHETPVHASDLVSLFDPAMEFDFDPACKRVRLDFGPA